MSSRIRQWTVRIAKFSCWAIVAAYLTVLASFQISKGSALRKLESESVVITTAKGDVEVYIRGDLSPSNSVVLVTHGSPGGYDQAALMMTPVFDDSFSYIIPSRPGYLRTPIAIGRTPLEQADAYAALLNELSVENVSVIGASGGGPSALEFASHHPDRVNSLVLYAAVSQSLTEATLPPASSVERVTNAVFGHGFLEWTLTRPLIWFPDKIAMLGTQYPDSWPRIVEDRRKTELFTKLVTTSLTHFPKDRRFTGYANDVIQYSTLDLGSFAELSVPTLIVHGTADTNVPFSASESLGQEIEDAETLWIDQADHFMILSRWEEIRPAMNSFLRKHSRSSAPRE